MSKCPECGYDWSDEPAALHKDGPLSEEDLAALDSLRETHPNLWRHIRECGQAVLLLHKEGAGGATIAQKFQGVVNKWLAEAERLHNLTPDERERDSRRNGLLEAVADVVAFTAEHDCGAQAPRPLQRTLPDEQFKGVVVEPIGTERKHEGLTVENVCKMVAESTPKG